MNNTMVFLVQKREERKRELKRRYDSGVIKRTRINYGSTQELIESV